MFYLSLLNRFLFLPTVLSSDTNHQSLLCMFFFLICFTIQHIFWFSYFFRLYFSAFYFSFFWSLFLGRWKFVFFVVFFCIRFPFYYIISIYLPSSYRYHFLSFRPISPIRSLSQPPYCFSKDSFKLYSFVYFLMLNLFLPLSKSLVSLFDVNTRKIYVLYLSVNSHHSVYIYIYITFEPWYAFIFLYEILLYRSVF